MKNKIIYLVALMFSLSLVTEANQSFSWPGAFYFKKCSKIKKEASVKKTVKPEFEISPGAWLL